jgi:hypothetical protein
MKEMYSFIFFFRPCCREREAENVVEKDRSKKRKGERERERAWRRYLKM